MAKTTSQVSGTGEDRHIDVEWLYAYTKGSKGKASATTFEEAVLSPWIEVETNRARVDNIPLSTLVRDKETNEIVRSPSLTTNKQMRKGFREALTAYCTRYMVEGEPEVPKQLTGAEIDTIIRERDALRVEIEKLRRPTIPAYLEDIIDYDATKDNDYYPEPKRVCRSNGNK